ncbi:MAG: dipeptide ABC transporter ATP-binding protein [Bacillota bacterium]|jgi:oligopeptide/dipeptide ABC transporter ATP-binding protein|nr:dipeptide ABC transporter ATP-binding protein [Bacillota bacterium]HHT91266.1 dipeptide ABC transporter ATP-binding protein [Bacillota bacterium]
MTEDTIILEVNKLTKHFPIYRGFLRKVVGSVQALNDVSFSVKKQETLGIVGESGCGKTTLARVMLRAYEPTSGEVLFNQDGEMINVFSLKKAELKRLRRNIQIIFQDPLSSLNPRKTVLEIIGEPLLIHGVAHGQELKSRVCELLKMVGLSVNHLDRYPNAFSGGQRQRIAIARALALQPQVVLCDEPVSALDVSIQAQIINLLQDLQKDLGLTYLFISHDLSVVEHISDRVAVMYLGSIVELAPSSPLYQRPRHPYTEALLSATPTIDPATRKKRIILPGELPNPSNPPPGCKFHTRCTYAQDVCKTTVPAWEEISPGHWTACHRAKELELRGVGELKSSG